MDKLVLLFFYIGKDGILTQTIYKLCEKSGSQKTFFLLNNLSSSSVGTQDSLSR